MAICGDSVQLRGVQSGAGEVDRLPHPTLKSLSQLINNYVMVALIWPLDGASVRMLYTL